MTMLAPLPSVEAFRRDAISIDGAELDDAVAAAWLESATRLERAAMTRDAERERLLSGLLAQHHVVSFPEAPVSIPAVFSTISGLASEMEDQACFRMAHSVLSTLLIVVAENEVTLRGRAIATQGRLARQLGETAAAVRYYEEVERLGVEHQLPELTGRAWVGLGILASQRGAYPEARQRFLAVIDLEGAARETVAHAHHELMVTAASARDFDAAASHGWQAFKGACTCTQETEALLNLAQLLLDAGHARAALRGFAAALARKPLLRHELPILGGAACAAAAALARPAGRAVVRNFTERLEDLLVKSLRNGERLPHATTSALVEVSEALAVVGDEDRSRDIAERAAELANARGFHQLAYRLENPVLVAEPAPLARATEAIIAAVDELDGAELVAAG
jgi:tetratricopeptide (TPR) repeat protein